MQKLLQLRISRKESLVCHQFSCHSIQQTLFNLEIHRKKQAITIATAMALCSYQIYKQQTTCPLQGSNVLHPEVPRELCTRGSISANCFTFNKLKLSNVSINYNLHSGEGHSTKYLMSILLDGYGVSSGQSEIRYFKHHCRTIHQKIVRLKIPKQWHN